MTNETISKTKEFRAQLFRLFKYRPDAIMDLVDAIADQECRNVIEASLSPLFRRQYSSITDAVDNLFRRTTNEHPKGSEIQEDQLRLSRLLADQCPSPKVKGFTLLATDCTARPRIYSRKVADRTIVHAPNHVPGQKPITVGHEYSHVVYLPEDEQDRNAHWTFPLSVRRVHSNESGPKVGFEQVKSLITQSSLCKNLCVVVADAAYSTKEWVVRGSSIPNMVQISRLRNNRILYRKSVSVVEVRRRGRPASYGEPFKLDQVSAPDEEIRLDKIMPSGKSRVVVISAWSNILIRGDRLYRTDQCPVDVVRVQVLSQDGRQIFKKPLFLLVAGNRRKELRLREIYESYVQRYDIEHYFRFGKQKLLMARSQTPDTRHEENLSSITMLSYVMLYLTRELASETRRRWDGRSRVLKNRTISPTLVQRDYRRIIQEIGTPARFPKTRGKSPGRRSGDVVQCRLPAPVIRKSFRMAIRC